MTRIPTNQKPNFHELLTNEIRGNSIKIRVHSCQKDFFRNLFLFLILLSFLLQGCYAQEQTKTAGQTELIDPYSWDFGQAKEGEVLKHAFALKNESRETLTLKDVSSSCGCTVPEVKNKVLLPGESTLIEVKFNTKGYSGNTQQFVYVHTDSLDKPIIRFIIKADVIKTK